VKLKALMSRVFQPDCSWEVVFLVGSRETSRERLSVCDGSGRLARPFCLFITGPLLVSVGDKLTLRKPRPARNTCAGSSFASWASKCNNTYGKLMCGIDSVAGRIHRASAENRKWNERSIRSGLQPRLGRLTLRDFRRRSATRCQQVSPGRCTATPLMLMGRRSSIQLSLAISFRKHLGDHALPPVSAADGISYRRRECLCRCLERGFFYPSAGATAIFHDTPELPVFPGLSVENN
jgi:hypothetical protein